ncbi:protein of unknown function [Xenorhabdus doucetiae]|uniref:Uncharacterized protein n=1 Tax=Xenorhabdus doucetiae TaxID=351671 RepID=A0A068QU64_9GAMM|nr:protein of unknown function [Xenorhabdus doucetiae]
MRLVILLKTLFNIMKNDKKAPDIQRLNLRKHEDRIFTKSYTLQMEVLEDLTPPFFFFHWYGVFILTTTTRYIQISVIFIFTHEFLFR